MISGMGMPSVHLRRWRVFLGTILIGLKFTESAAIAAMMCIPKMTFIAALMTKTTATNASVSIFVTAIHAEKPTGATI
jgi:hypothetical protein